MVNNEKINKIFPSIILWGFVLNEAIYRVIKNDNFYYLILILLMILVPFRYKYNDNVNKNKSTIFIIAMELSLVGLFMIKYFWE
jgi:hypothetical protein